jgi:hypothetical protein
MEALMQPLARSVLILGLALCAAAAAEAQPYGMGLGMMGPGYGMQFGMGPGYGMGPGMMSYGMGSGMMGGMMGARNQACNQDGSVPNFGFRRNAGALNLSVGDVKNYAESSLAWNGNPNLKMGEVKERDADSITADVVTKDNSLVEEIAFDRHTGFSCFVR